MEPFDPDSVEEHETDRTDDVYKQQAIRWRRSAIMFAVCASALAILFSSSMAQLIVWHGERRSTDMQMLSLIRTNNETLQIVKDATSPEAQAKNAAGLQVLIAQLDCNSRRGLQDLADQMLAQGRLSAPVHVACP